MTYASVAQIRAALSISDTSADTLIVSAADAASAMVDAYCGRSFGSVASSTRYFSADDRYLLHTDDIAGTAVTIEIDENLDGTWLTFAPTDYQLEPLNAISNGVASPYTAVRCIGDYVWPVSKEAGVRITAVWGRSAVPEAVEYATILLAERLFKRTDAPLGVAGFGDMGAIRVSRYMDPDVELLLAPYRTGANAAGGVA